jgi:hypothetical protein
MADKNCTDNCLEHNSKLTDLKSLPDFALYPFCLLPSALNTHT